jgi:DNA-binding CsgD family transcriptional regulator
MNIKLSPREIKLAAFLRMNMSSKEIAKLLSITTRGVELARYRLRKKLKLEREQNLVEYLIDLDKAE